MATLLSYALTTVADVKETLGIASGDNTKNNLIIRKINLATEMIEGYCNLAYNHHFAQTTYTDEEYDAPNTRELLLLASPVTTLTSLSKRDSSDNEGSWDTIETEDYFLNSAAGIIESNLLLTGHYNRFKATYTAGYSTIPADLAEAAATLAAYMVSNATTGAGVQSIREGQRQITYAVNSQEKSLIESLGLDNVLNRYIRYAVLSDA